MLGIPFGKEAFVYCKLQGFLDKVHDHAERIVDAFADVDLQVGNILFRRCCPTRFRHLLRQMRRSQLLWAAQAHDEMMVSFFLRLNHLNELTLQPGSPSDSSSSCP